MHIIVEKPHILSNIPTYENTFHLDTSPNVPLFHNLTSFISWDLPLINGCFLLFRNRIESSSNIHPINHGNQPLLNKDI